MEHNYDLNMNKNIKYSIQDNLFIVDEEEKIFVFLIFCNRFNGKMSLLFKEIKGDKMNLENVIFAQNIIDNFQEYFYNCDGYNGNI